MQIRPKGIRQNWKPKIRMFQDYLVDRPILQKKS